MNFSAPFIRRPIATILLMAGLLLCGLATYPLLPVAALPNVNYPTILVTAQLPGADPQTMASTVATPLEQQMGQIPGVTQLTSTSALGVTSVTVQFELSRTVERRAAARDEHMHERRAGNRDDGARSQPADPQRGVVLVDVNRRVDVFRPGREREQRVGLDVVADVALLVAGRIAERVGRKQAIQIGHIARRRIPRESAATR